MATLVARRARRTGNVFWGCSAYPKCDFTTNDEPTGALHDAHDDGKGAVARKGEEGICLTCGAAVPLPWRASLRPRLEGGPPNPAALERPARGGTPRRALRRPGGATRRRVDGTDRSRTRATSGTRRTAARERGPAPVTGSEALRRFLRSLEARDTSPNTRRSYEASVTGYLAWLEAARRADWQAPARPRCARTWPSVRRTCPSLRRPAPRRPAGLPPLLRPGRASHLAIRGAPSPRRACHDASHACSRWPRSRRCSRSSTRTSSLRATGTTRTEAHSTRTSRCRSPTRDRALVETAYAAGLRISELAAADLGSLDLRRGEIRVLGKGRKERIGLLGRPAQGALGDYLDEGRPVLADRAIAARAMCRPPSS